jgi:hypothetical protein
MRTATVRRLVLTSPNEITRTERQPTATLRPQARSTMDRRADPSPEGALGSLLRKRAIASQTHSIARIRWPRKAVRF